MKPKFLLSVSIISLFISSCIYYDDCCIEPYYESSYDPVIMSRSQLDSNVHLLPPMEIIESGKIYVYQNLIFVGERNEGYHIIDNSDPNNPVNINFLQLKASTDIAVRNNVLFVNQGTDLVTLNYDQSTNSISVANRISNTFPPLLSPDNMMHHIDGDSVVIGWTTKL